MFIISVVLVATNDAFLTVAVLETGRGSVWVAFMLAVGTSRVGPNSVFLGM